MATRKKRTEIEWVGGIAPMPGYVTGEGEPYRPEGLVWMGADGAVLGSTIGKPGEVVATAAASLRQAMERPMWGPPHEPTRVRVASAELAAALRSGFPDLEIACAPTPEIDSLMALMRSKLGEDYDAHQSYVPPDSTPEAMASFFRAMAALFRAKPWTKVPSDDSLFGVTIEALDVHDAVLSVIGQMGQSYGLVLFEKMSDFEAYVESADAFERDEPASLPQHYSLNFERGADLSPGLRKEVADHRWEIAGADAYPWLAAVDEDLLARPPTAKEVRIFEAIALALPQALKASKALREGWDGEEPWVRTFRVRTHAGELDVTLRTRRATDAFDLPTYVLMAALFDMEGGELASDERFAIQEELLQRFEVSPEVKGIANARTCEIVMDYAASHFDSTIATLSARDLREIVFELLPSKMSVEPSAARGMIEELRAFYRFLRREVNLPQAEACLCVLGEGAEARLEAALMNPANFGMAKSLVMAGRAAGFDVDSREGLEAWLTEAQSKRIPIPIPSIGLGGPPPALDKGAAKAKKSRRKAADRSRKKNR